MKTDINARNNPKNCLFNEINADTYPTGTQVQHSEMLPRIGFVKINILCFIRRSYVLDCPSAQNQPY